MSPRRSRRLVAAEWALFGAFALSQGVYAVVGGVSAVVGALFGGSDDR